MSAEVLRHVVGQLPVTGPLDVGVAFTAHVAADVVDAPVEVRELLAVIASADDDWVAGRLRVALTTTA